MTISFNLPKITFTNLQLFTTINMALTMLGHQLNWQESGLGTIVTDERMIWIDDPTDAEAVFATFCNLIAENHFVR
jgi:hypothetical protein